MDSSGSDESLIDVDVIVPEDGEQRVMLPHIEEVNKLAVVYILIIFH